MKTATLTQTRGATRPGRGQRIAQAAGRGRGWPRSIGFWALAITPLMALAFNAPAVAGPPRADVTLQLADDVQLRLISFRATTTHKKIDSALKSFADEIKKRGGYTGASTLNRDSAKVKLKSAHTFSMGAGYTAKITPVSEDKDRVTVEIAVSGPSGNSKTKVSFTKGKYQLQSWKLNSTDAVFLAVSGK